MKMESLRLNSALSFKANFEPPMKLSVTNKIANSREIEEKSFGYFYIVDEREKMHNKVPTLMCLHI